MLIAGVRLISPTAIESAKMARDDSFDVYSLAMYSKRMRLAYNLHKPSISQQSSIYARVAFGCLIGSVYHREQLYNHCVQRNHLVLYEYSETGDIGTIFIFN